MKTFEVPVFPDLQFAGKQSISLLKRTIWFAPVLIFLLLYAPRLSAQIERKEIVVGDFQKICVGKDLRVILVADAVPSVTIEGVDKVIKKVKVRERKGELYLTRRGFAHADHKVFIYIGVDTLSSIDASRQAVVETSGILHAREKLIIRAQNDAIVTIRTDATNVIACSNYYAKIEVNMLGDEIHSDMLADPVSRSITQYFIAVAK